MKAIARFHCLLAMTIVLYTVRQGAAESPFDEMIVFGDSLSDTGNVFDLSSGAFAGEPYFGGRFSNGPVWVEWLAHGIGFNEPTEDMPVPAPSLRGGTNYAYGGAQAGARFSRPLSALTGIPIPNIGLQIDTFLADLAAGTRTLNGDELLVVQGGSNNNSGHLAAMEIAHHVRTLAAAGGEFIFVPNLWQVSQDPFAVNDDRRWDVFTADFNATLNDELDALEQKYHHENRPITIIRSDWFGLHADILSRPDFYGLTNVTDPVCPACAAVTDEHAGDSLAGDPDEFLYWDSVHLTAAGHKIFGGDAAHAVRETLASSGSLVAPPGAAVAGVPEPGAIALLVSGLIGMLLAAVMRRESR